MNAEALLEHRDFLRGLARRLVFAGEDPDDVVQETYARAVAHPPKPGPGIRGWLATVARNVVRESRRGRLRRLAREAAVAGGETTPSATEIREREAARSRVVEAVLALDEPYREVILLRFYEELPPRVIAGRLGIPVETVRTRQKRAMAVLRGRLDAEYGGDRKAWTAALLPLAAAKATAGVGAALFAGAAAALLVAVVVAFGVGAEDVSAPPSLPVADAGGEPQTGAGGSAGASREEPAGAAEDARPGEELAPPPGGILVVDAAGRPADASVSTTPERVADVNRALSLGRTGRDGALRRFEILRLPRKYLWAQGDAGVAGPVAWKQDGAVLVLGEGRVVSGVVRDGEGRPVPGAMLMRGGTTDANGRYRASHLFPGTPYRLSTGLLGTEAWRRPEEGVEVVLLEEERVRNLDLVVERPKGPELLVVLRGCEHGVGMGDLSVRFDDREDAALFLPAREVRVLVAAGRFAGKRVTLRASLPGAGIVETDVEVPTAARTVEVPLSFGGDRAWGRGLVLDATGKPVAGAAIYASEDPTEPYSGDKECETDAAGVFQLTPRLLVRHLLARGPDTSSAWMRAEDRRKDLVLRLGPAGTVLGRVLDATSGEPVPFVPVHLAIGEMRLAPLTWETVADAEGRYRFAGVPLGMRVLPLVPHEARATPTFNLSGVTDALSGIEMLEAGYAAVLEKEGDVFPRDIPVHRNPGGEVAFRLEFPDGGPRPEKVRVRHRFETRSAWGYREELLPLDAVAGTVTVYLAEGKHTLAFRSAALFAVSGRLAIDGDREREERALVMAPLPPAEVRLTDAAGRPLPRADVRVRVKVRGGFAFGGGSAPTDARGRARVDDVLPPPTHVKEGRILLWIEAKGLFSGSHESPDRVLTAEEYLDLRRAAGTGLLTIDLPVRTGKRIEVPVLDTAGRPVAGVRVELVPKGAFSETEAVSDAAGILHLDLLDTSRAKVRAEAPWTGSLEVDRFLRTEDRHRQRADRALRVSRLRTVRIDCVDASGRPLPGVLVDVTAFGGSIDDLSREERRTDADGGFTVEIPDREVSLQLGVRGRSGAGVRLEPGVKEYRAVLEVVGKLLVEIAVPPDFKGDRVYVALHAADQVDGAGKRRGKGTLVERRGNRFFRQFEVPARAYRVVARDWVGYWHGEAECAAGARIVRVAIARTPTWPIEARIVGPDGEPTVGRAARVTLRDHSMGTYEVTAETDGRGIVRLEVPEGAVGDLRVQVDGCIRTRPNPAKIEAPPEVPVEFTAVPGFVLTVSFIMPEATDRKAWPEMKIRKFGADGRERPAGWSSAGSIGNRRTYHFDCTPEPCRFEFEVLGKVHRVEVPGHPIDSPTFDLR